MRDGILQTATGVVVAPKIVVIATTTDKGFAVQSLDLQAAKLSYT